MLHDKHASAATESMQMLRKGAERLGTKLSGGGKVSKGLSAYAAVSTNQAVDVLALVTPPPPCRPSPE